MGIVSLSRVLLIVDDSPAVRSAVGDFLARVGDWESVLTARDAGEGLLLAAEHHPDAIVLDNRMPGGDGIDVLGELRRTCPQARIVMHTSEDSWLLRERASDLGADGFLAKGRPLDELATLLDASAA